MMVLNQMKKKMCQSSIDSFFGHRIETKNNSKPSKKSIDNQFAFMINRQKKSTVKEIL